MRHNVMRQVAIAGASGFIGRALVQHLLEAHPDIEVVGLSRSSMADMQPQPRFRHVSCDLFNLRDVEQALQGIDTVVYLVHSMMPSARLTQATFADLDVLCADNVARAAHLHNISHIVYLGGLVPQRSTSSPLSMHLQSRLEVEHTLAAYGTPVTALRAGMVIAQEGSSFQIMVRLVRRLPVMIAPKWTLSRTQCVALQDAVRMLAYAVEHPELAGKSYDIGSPEVVTYQDLMAMTAAIRGRTLRLWSVPWYSPNLSLLWVTLVTGAPRALVGPLVESLQHDMVATDGRWLQQRAAADPGASYRGAASLDDALREAIAADSKPRMGSLPRAPAPSRADAKRPLLVRSVQRLVLPMQRDAAWVAREYVRWAAVSRLGWLIRIEENADRVVRFTLRGLKLLLLELTFVSERSSPDRQLYRITGGALAHSEGNRARLEFRQVPHQPYVLAAIHEYRPSLPWVVYKYTQALVHSWVMRKFGLHLQSVSHPRRQ
jgi:uncharacterized protein YbjT (DUF2867 family)